MRVISSISHLGPSQLLVHAANISTALSACASLIIFIYDRKIIQETSSFLTYAKTFVDSVVVITLPAIGGIIGTISLTHLTRSRLTILLGFIYAACLISVCVRDFMKNDTIEVEPETAMSLLLLGSFVNILANGIFFYQAPSKLRALQLGANFPLLIQIIQMIRSWGK